MTIKKQFISVILALVFSATSFAADTQATFKPLDLSKAKPTLEQISSHKIPATTAEGEYQMKMIGEKFALVATAEGQPIVVFDLSLHHLKGSEILLGGIGFGDMTVSKLIKGLRKAKRSSKPANDIDAEAQELAEIAEFNAAPMSEKDQAEATKRGLRLMGDLRFTEEWAQRNHVTERDDKPGVAFRYADFSMNDINFPNEDLRKRTFDPMIGLAKVLYPDQVWDLDTIKEFAKEFMFRYRGKEKPGYDIYWDRNQRDAAKQPPLPGFVVNFVNPYANLSYKHQMRQFDQYGETLRQQLGTVGILMDLVLSNVTHHLAERLDYHERQLISLLEANARFEYNAGLPLDLVDMMTEMLYLSRFRGSSDDQMTDGPAKRKYELAMQEIARPKALKRINKIVSGKGIGITEVGGGKFALAFETKNGQPAKFRGIYGLGTKPTKLMKRPTLHVNSNGPGFKIAERYLGETVGFLFRSMLPGFWNFRIGSAIFIQLRIPPAVYQHWFRQRSVAEVELEGELVGLVEEAAKGRYNGFGLSMPELTYVRNQLRQTAMNPYELSIKEEPSVIEANLKLLKQILAGGMALEQTATQASPASM